jgi:hypothetical protein
MEDHLDDRPLTSANSRVSWRKLVQQRIRIWVGKMQAFVMRLSDIFVIESQSDGQL